MNTFLEFWQLKGEQGGTKIVSVYAGRFMPFHTGHYHAFVELSKTFDENHSYIVTGDVPKNVGDPSRYPFRFNEKEFIIKTMFGIPDNKIIFDSQPYTPGLRHATLKQGDPGLLSKYDPDGDILVIGLSEKDMKENPRFVPGTTKAGKPTYFQTFKSFEASKPFREHGYVYTLKTYPVDPQANILQAGIQDPDEEKHAVDLANSLFPGGEVSGTIVRNAWRSTEEQDRRFILTALYGSYNDKVESLFNKKLGG